MWFRLASANWTNTGNLGTMDSISGSWTVTCSTSGGIVKTTGDGMVTKGGTWTGTFTLSEGATFTSATLTPSSAGTVSTSTSGTTVTVTIASVSNNCTLAVVATGGNSGGDSSGSGGGSTTPDTDGVITLSNFSVATKSDGTTKYLKVEDGCMVMAFNVETNTNYSVIDTGTHNRFRFYGRTTKDSSSDMVANLEFDGIIGDQNSVSGIDTWYDYTFNSGEYQTVYVYLSTSSSNAPALTVTKQTNSTAINMLQSRGFKTVDSVKTLYNAVNCITAAVNVTTNTNYKIVDSGTHNRFRFYGRTTSDDIVTMHTDLLAMDGIIADTSNVSGIDSLSEYTINTGNYQTIYIYLVGDSTSYSPNITIMEV